VTTRASSHVASETSKRMKPLPMSKTHRWLEPGPIVLVTTADRRRPNIMTLGFHTMIQHDPALVGSVIGPWDFRHNELRKTRQCVIAVPPVSLARSVVDIGNCSGEDVDKFDKFSLTPLPAKTVGAPLVAECLANIECQVQDTRFVNKYNLFVLRVTALWANRKHLDSRMLHHNGNGTFTVGGRTIDLRERMVKWRELID
jgi:flavin reductase (DIM6/NTAB) family NADH-FMN oxidoreductase RutF